MFGFSSFRAAIQPIEPPQEDLDAKIWTMEPVGEYTNVMDRNQLQDYLKEKELQEALSILEPKPEPKPEIYNTQIRTFNPQPNERGTGPNFQHPMLTYNLVKGKK